MFDYFDSMSVIMKMIRQGGIVVHKSEREKVIILVVTNFSEKELIYEPIRLYLYVPP